MLVSKVCHKCLKRYTYKFGRRRSKKMLLLNPPCVKGKEVIEKYAELGLTGVVYYLRYKPPLTNEIKLYHRLGFIIRLRRNNGNEPPEKCSYLTEHAVSQKMADKET